MPWVRIDEHALHHPKIASLTDGSFRLWVQSLMHCQHFLTDGAVKAMAFRTLTAYSPKRHRELVNVGLWDTAGDGVCVHDYLDWNESRESVERKRQAARDRVKGKRLEGVTGNNPDGANAMFAESSQDVRANFAATSQKGAVTWSGNTPEGEVKKEGELRGETIRPALVVPPADARSKRPIFKGQRFVVFEWMLDDLSRMLGPHADNFNLDEWFYELDRQATAANIVVPQRDGGKWLMERTQAEALRRGLPVAAAASHNPKTAGNVAAAQRWLSRKTS